MAVGFAGIVRYLDTRALYMPYTAAVTLAIATLIYAASRRPFFSLYAAGSVTLLLGIASKVKYDQKGFALHYYDLAFTGTDSAALAFLTTHYSAIFYGGVAVLGAAIMALTVIYHIDKPLAPRFPVRAGMFAGSVALAVVLYPQPRPDNPAYLPFIAGYNGSAFYFSLADFDPMGQKIKLADRLAPGVQESLPDGMDCEGSNRPDVMLVLSESQADPGLFPGLKLPTDFRNLFASGDGTVRPLTVETYGGGTWVTNFSVLTGLSSTDFGWQSSYVTEVMEGRIRGALPELLAACGYRTVTVMPMLYRFVNEGAFLRSIGFQEIYDAEALGLTVGDKALTDRVYFEFAEKLIVEHRKTSDQPLFISLQTMFPHSPYDTLHGPPDDVAAEIHTDDPHLNEYMRRVLASRLDVQRFLAEVERNTSARGTVVLDYGDHQSVATKSLLEQNGGLNLTDFRSPAYRTFVSVHAFDTPLKMDVFDAPMDVGYLAAALVEAADLPSSPMMRDLADLRRSCKGRYHSCDETTLVDRHLTMRVNGGLLDLN
jgi:hypothetical protein